MTVGWQFTRSSPLQEQYVPREEELLKNYRSYCEALVREFVQNALDARTGERLRIKISFGVRRFSGWLDGLTDHIEACFREEHLKLSIDQDAYRSLLVGMEGKFLTLEDFETTGLTGETGRDGIPQESNFYDFVYWAGGSRKTGRKGGRWGVGKNVYYMCSGVRTFFALTKRHDDGRCLLVGKCTLGPHTLNNERFAHDGYFREESGDPVEDPHIIEDFSRDFGVERNEPGLSIVIPFVQAEITPDAVKSALISHYFYPIARGVLSAEITDGREHIEINSETLLRIASELEWKNTYWQGKKKEEVERLLRFVHECPRITPLTIEASHEDNLIPVVEKMNIRDRYFNGEILAFKVPILIKPRKAEGIQSFFTVYLQRDGNLRNTEAFFIRSDLLIPSPAKDIKGRCVRIAVIADDEGIAQFLGDAETPYHEDWTSRGTGLAQKYENAQEILRLVKNFPVQLVDTLEGLCLERKDWELFKKYFHILRPEKPDRQEGVIEPRPPRPMPPKIRLLEVTPADRGFRLRLTPEGKRRLPMRAKITCAYATLKGDARKYYEPTDFDMRALSVRHRGCSIIRREENLLELEISDQDFELEVVGFDPNRDLRIWVEAAFHGE